MTETKKRVTVADAMAGLDQLHQQVVKNRESLDSKLCEFDKEVKATLEQWSKRNGRDREGLASDFEELRTAVNRKHAELSGRIDEIGGVIAAFRQTAESSRETTLDIKKTVDSLQESFAGQTQSAGAPELVSVTSITPGTAWTALRKNVWYPWLRFAFFCLVGLLVYHYVMTPVLTQKFPPAILPNVLRPNIDVNSPVGAATLEVSREPFRSDTASREAFGRIFDALDHYVRDGRLTDFEGYYNEFGKRMQESLDGTKYQQWAELWRRLAVVCHRYGGGDNDLRVFNANLQSAARVVAGRVSDLPAQNAYPNGYHAAPGYGHAYGTVAPASGTGNRAADPADAYQATPWPFLQNQSNPQ